VGRRLLDQLAEPLAALLVLVCAAARRDHGDRIVTEPPCDRVEAQRGREHGRENDDSPGRLGHRAIVPPLLR
jgi:hypothetical protein